jgi:soluble lytic murein transglycosylase-like protein
MNTQEIISLIQDYAWSIGFPPEIAIAQLDRESGHFRQDVIYGPFIGAAGEKGLAQFIPDTWARFGLGGNPYNPEDSLNAWAYYIGYLRGLFSEDYSRILQAYNGGEGNVQRGTVNSAAKRYAQEILAASGNYSDYQSIVADDSQDPVESSLFWPIIGISIFGLILLTSRR